MVSDDPAPTVELIKRTTKIYPMARVASARASPRWVSRQSGVFNGAVRVVDGGGRHARAPAMVRWPGKVPAGAVTEEISTTGCSS
jgi:hypothetical protein